MIRIFILADTRLYREGLAEILDRDGRLEVVGAVADLSEALRHIEELDPDALLIDVDMPRALEIIRSLRRARARAKVVALGLAESTRDVVAYAEAGISGYVGREGSVGELVGAVRKAARDEFSCSSRVAAALLHRVRDRALHPLKTTPGSILTPRERQIAGLLDEGLTNKEIATKLFIEVATVKNHVHHILEKLHASTRGEAAAKLRRLEEPGPTLPATVIHKTL